MTQQNAALVEESAAAAQSLREQADHLAREVSMFKVNAASYGNAQSAPGAVRTPTASRPTTAPADAARTAQVAAAPAARPRVAGAAAAPSGKPAALPAQGSRKAAAPSASEDDWESF